MMIYLGHSNPNIILRDIPDHIIFCQTERTVIRFTDTLVNGSSSIDVFEEMVGYRHSRIHSTHYCTESFRSRVDLGTDL